jgi:GTP-binding protein
MRAGTARFVTGAARAEQFPPSAPPEVAFAGRSNVGKSSLLNRLVAQRGLARVSRTPGRTQQINFFAVGQALMLADLPGYGFARVPAAVQRGWQALVESYLSRRRQLRAVVLIVDIRRGIEEEEEMLLDFLGAHHRRVILVLTKADKVSRSARADILRRLRAERPDLDPIVFSALTGEGSAQVWGEVSGVAECRPRSAGKGRDR